MGNTRLRSTAWQVVRALTALALIYASAGAVAYVLGAYPRHRVESAWMVFGALALVSLVLSSSSREIDSQVPIASLYQCLAAIALAAVLYWPSYSVGLFSDDFLLLDASESWRLIPAEWQHVRPTALLVWALVQAIGLGSPIILHVINICLHGGNSFLCYRLGRAAGATHGVAASAGALFLTFPGAVEAVTWVSGLQEVLMATFVLACLLTAIRGANLVAFAFLVLATLTKETAVAVPALLVLLSIMRPVSRKLIASSFAWCVMFGAARLLLQSTGEFLQSPDRYFLKEFVVRIFGGLSLPWTQQQIADVPLVSVAGIIALAVLLGTGLVVRRGAGHQRTWMLVFGGWVVLAAAPVYSYLYVAPDLQGSRYLYLPATGWALLLAAMGWNSAGSTLGRAAVVTLVALGVGGTLTQQQRWQAASAYREQVLSAAREAAARLECDYPHFENGPDTLGGVYIFRNGLDAAFRRSAGHGSEAPGVPGCQLRWDGGGFVPASE